MAKTQTGAEFIQSEGNGGISRNTVTVRVPTGTTYDAGTVLGRITATGLYVPYDSDASDGSEVAAGILIAAQHNPAAASVDVRVTILDYAAVVRSADLIWGADVDELKGFYDLAARGIRTDTDRVELPNLRVIASGDSPLRTVSIQARDGDTWVTVATGTH